MQPTNDPIDYEKVLQIHFHYDMKDVFSDSCMVYQLSRHTRSDRAAALVHKFICKMVDHDSDRSYYTIGGHGTYTESEVVTILPRAWRLKEYLQDWYDAMEGFTNEDDYNETYVPLAAIDVIIENVSERINQLHDDRRSPLSIDDRWAIGTPFHSSYRKRNV